MAEARRLIRLAAQIEPKVSLPDGRLAVALSGGADSAALLWLCVSRQRPVRAIHVHHGLAASDMLAEAASRIAGALSTPFEVVRVSVKDGPSPEDQARRVRYEAFESALERDEWLLTGHTSDDQAETVLDRLLRSSGTDGLSGIPERRPPYARPILAVSRSETRELATLAGLEWRDDPVNDELEPLRNRIRRRLIPALEAEFNPRLRQSLATTARLLGSDAAYLDSVVSAVVYRGGPDDVEVAASIVSTAHPVLAARMARRLLEVAGLPSASPEAVGGVLAVAGGLIRAHQPGGGLVVSRRGAMLTVRSDLPEKPDAVDLSIPGETSFGGWRFRSTVATNPPLCLPLGPGWMVADADKVGELTVVPGLSDESAHKYLADSGVSGPDRRAYPLVQFGGETIWIPSVRRFPLGWVDEHTERYLVIRSQSERICHK